MLPVDSDSHFGGLTGDLYSSLLTMNLYHFLDLFIFYRGEGMAGVRVRNNSLDVYRAVF